MSTDSYNENMNSDYVKQLTGGHPNSLGNTIDVVEHVLANSTFDELIACYDSEDQVVRLRVSNAVKRVYQVKPEWVEAHIDTFLNKIAQINQPSTWWTMSQLFLWMSDKMSDSQRDQAKELVKKYLDTTNDWIVENTAMDILANWCNDDPQLKLWLKPRLEKYQKSSRKSVANRAKKILAQY